MALVILIGGGRKLLRHRVARRSIARLDDPAISPEDIEAVADFGREGLFDLFRLFGTAQRPEQRAAAGRAIARLWAGDQLVSEEEHAFTRRGFDVEWQARRRYPREFRAEIPVSVTYGVPVLKDAGGGISPGNLEWSHRITGARRAALEEETPWKAGEGHFDFTIIPEDFESNGPHQLVLEARVRTVGLTSSWQLELPKVPFRFEFDPNLEAASLLAQPDESSRQLMERAVRLESSLIAEGEIPRLLPIHVGLVIRNPPCIVVDALLPCDLAHVVEIEIEGVAGRYSAGHVVLSGQGASRSRPDSPGRVPRRFPLGPIRGIEPPILERPGTRRIRCWLKADLDLGWGDPSIRSIWPGEIESEWVEVETTRR